MGIQHNMASITGDKKHCGDQSERVALKLHFDTENTENRK